MKDFGFYLVITNPVVGYARCAEAAVRAGVKIVQLRMKHAAREDVLREAREMRRRRAVTLLTGALCAMLLLVVSMLGQACFSSRSAAGRPAAENVIVFSQKETVPAAAVHAEKMSAAELTGVQLLRETRGEISPSEGSDRITVLNVRRGRELRHFWQSLSDAFSAAGG